MNKLRVGIVGATGMVGQRFITLLQNHPYFELTCLAASKRSAGKTYAEAISGRWELALPCPDSVSSMTVYDAADIPAIAKQVDFVLCAVDMPKDEIRALEEAYAKAEIPVVSNNSANRHTPDVPMMIPETTATMPKLLPHSVKGLAQRRGLLP